jgi:site-specific recombinase XerD
MSHLLACIVRSWVLRRQIPDVVRGRSQIASATSHVMQRGLHDLRHYFASYLIHSGVDIKTVQKRMRHATASTTLDVFGHLFPDSDDSTRDAISHAFDARPRTDLRVV